MPRTKVAKSSKRNREAAIREEKIRDFDASLDQFLCFMEQKGQSYISAIEGDLRMLIQRTPKTVLRMNMGEFMALNLTKFNDWTPAIASANSAQSLYSTLSAHSLKPSSSRDEGYLTEDSNDNRSGSSVSALGSALIQQQQRGRTPGPLSSARQRKIRYSRSACAESGPPSALKPKPSAITEHSSRNKLRTPVCMRSKALSADRSQHTASQSIAAPSPPSAFMRWPKPGELVVSTCGSPIVAQVASNLENIFIIISLIIAMKLPSRIILKMDLDVDLKMEKRVEFTVEVEVDNLKMPDKYANVNIPVKNGMLSLRPKKLDNLNPDLIENIDPEIINQIRTLHASLDMIVKIADKGSTK